MGLHILVLMGWAIRPLWLLEGKEVVTRTFLHMLVRECPSSCNCQGARYKSVQKTRSAVAAGGRDWAGGTQSTKPQSYQSAGALRSPAHPPSPRWAHSHWALPGKEVLHCARSHLSCWGKREMISHLLGASGKQGHYQPTLQTQCDCLSWWQ